MFMRSGKHRIVMRLDLTAAAGKTRLSITSDERALRQETPADFFRFVSNTSMTAGPMVLRFGRESLTRRSRRETVLRHPHAPAGMFYVPKQIDHGLRSP